MIENRYRDLPKDETSLVFIGSSSIRLWDLAASFPDANPLNCGFGGAHQSDVNHFADRILFPFQPRTIVLYAGDNDIAAGLTPSQVLEDLFEFRRMVRSRLPESCLIYIGIKPSPSRWQHRLAMQQVNEAVCREAARDPCFRYVDVDGVMLDLDGKPDPALFVEDGLHLNAKGYQAWSRLVRPCLGPGVTLTP